nr:MAG TPA: hypothetical protein [Caudoviricetes sp.]
MNLSILICFITSLNHLIIYELYHSLLIKSSIFYNLLIESYD